MYTNYEDLENMVGLDAIVEERVRQVRDLGYDVSHDNSCHTPEELLRVGACYIDFATTEMEGAAQDDPHPFWPETSIPWVLEGSPIENAAKGAAFVAAALDLIYAQMTGGV